MKTETKRKNPIRHMEMTLKILKFDWAELMVACPKETYENSATKNIIEYLDFADSEKHNVRRLMK